MAVFSWGLGKSGQLGHGDTDTQHIPTPVTFDRCKQPCTDISSGGLYSCTLMKDGTVYSFGCGKYGRLGTGNEDTQVRPCLVNFPKGVKISQLSCGIWHGAAVDDSGQLYIWGYNKHGVQGHHVSATIASPSVISSLKSIQIAGVSCGNNFTLAWTTDGVAYSWGLGRHGVLGHGDTRDYHEPTVIEALKSEHVVHMSAGFAHCGAVCKSGRVFMFGKGKDLALGLGNQEDSSIPREVKELSDKGIMSVSCSVGEHHGHTLTVSHDGSVYSWGDGYKGKLGLGDQTSKSKPSRIPTEAFGGESIIQAAAGGIHSAAVSRDGHVFTWGCGSDGRSGHPEARGHRYLFRSDAPKLVETLVEKGRAVRVSASYYHTVALLE